MPHDYEVFRLNFVAASVSLQSLFVFHIEAFGAFSMEDITNEDGAMTHHPCQTIVAEGEGKPFEWSTTVDPSYVIHLIRQLLPLPNGRIASQPPLPLANHFEDHNRKKEFMKDPLVAINGVDTAAFAAVASNGMDKLATLKDDLADERGEAVAKDLSEKGRSGPENHHVQVTESSIERKQDASIVVENASQVPDHQDGQRPGSGKTQDTMSEDDAREEAGCVLWDLAATQSHAEFLVENHILEVLIGILHIPQSDRMREICLGIFGNLACHAESEKAMVGTEGLLSMVVQQLFVADAPSLIETCRLLSACLHSNEAVQWEVAMQSDEILQRIMWITSNTMNSQLLEKSTELLLAMVDSSKEETSTLLTPLLRLGLPDLLTDLIACEAAAISEGTSTRGDVVLDIVLRIGEAVSLSDEYASELARNQKLFALACQVIQSSERDEHFEQIGPSAITAMVLVANLLTENTGLVSKAFHDLSADAVVVERLLALLPLAGDDPGARNAFWSILGRICGFFASYKIGQSVDDSTLIKVLANGCYLLVDDLDEHRDDDVGDDENHALADHNMDAGTSRGLQAKLATAHNLIRIMKVWAASQNECFDQLQSIVENACEVLEKQITTANQGSSGSVQSHRNRPHENGSL
ncbi:hypothetical protein O6H91_01G011100 [Diphasiastrum complanatum]|uniref:Uncharacterized protein n=1 Tax=Diphasiastrum complanatum TaxID=34168 RepID=A0ACC2EN06_DIPCM|nr:hypothetical protein O6H91_01G011100 [Diphasiastrum complanatum]